MADPAAAHLRRNAYIYVRQSTLVQTVRNTESLLRQYDLAGRARELGWAEHQIVVVDDDLGRSGASAQGRKGFSDLVADVGLGKAGIVLSLECSRLARNNALFRYRNNVFCSAHGFMPHRAAWSLAGAASAAVGSA
jgi:DNA invertase Pin-like site-specific DNA recombinase